VVPSHRQIDRGILRAILRQTELSGEAFTKLL
jgi:predicted RNA binding protein YcfA (HicA-like mRNA interferase family)